MKPVPVHTYLSLFAAVNEKLLLSVIFLRYPKDIHDGILNHITLASHRYIHIFNYFLNYERTHG